MIDLTKIQAEQKAWSVYNFGEHPTWMPLLGVQEEVGELSHAYLKMTQGIRGDAGELADEAEDAIGDVVVFLLDVCNKLTEETGRRFDLGEILERTWNNVKKRDWRKFPRNGVTE